MATTDTIHADPRADGYFTDCHICGTDILPDLRADARPAVLQPDHLGLRAADGAVRPADSPHHEPGRGRVGDDQAGGAVTIIDSLRRAQRSEVEKERERMEETTSNAPERCATCEHVAHVGPCLAPSSGCGCKCAHAPGAARTLLRVSEVNFRVACAEALTGDNSAVVEIVGEARRAREAEKRWIAWASESRCIYCGTVLPNPLDDSQEDADRIKREHVASCEKHPLRATRAESAALAERVRALEEALREIAGDDPDDGCRQGHAKYAAQTLSRGKEAGK